MKKKVLPYLKNVYTSLKQAKKMLSSKSFEEGIETFNEIKSSNLWEQESYQTFNSGVSENDLTAEYIFHNKHLDMDLNIFVNTSARYISATRTSLIFENHTTGMNR